MKTPTLFFIMLLAFATSVFPSVTILSVSFEAEEGDVYIQELSVEFKDADFSLQVVHAPIQIKDINSYVLGLTKDPLVGSSFISWGDPKVEGSTTMIYWSGNAANTVIKHISEDFYTVYVEPKKTTSGIFTNSLNLLLDGDLLDQTSLSESSQIVFDVTDSPIVPEPGTAFLFLTGIASIGFRRKR